MVYNLWDIAYGFILGMVFMSVLFLAKLYHASKTLKKEADSAEKNASVQLAAGLATETK